MDRLSPTAGLPMRAPHRHHPGITAALCLVAVMAMGGSAHAADSIGSIYGSAPASAGDTIIIATRAGIVRTLTIEGGGTFASGPLPSNRYIVAFKHAGKLVQTYPDISVTSGVATQVLFDLR